MHTPYEYIYQERFLQFLIGSNNSFNSVRAKILLMKPLPLLNKVFSLILQEEQKHEITLASHCSSFMLLLLSLMFQLVLLARFLPKRIDQFVSIVALLVMLLKSITNFMVTLLDISPNRSLNLWQIMLSLWIIIPRLPLFFN